MSPSPPFPSPLLPHTHSPSGRPGIIGEHRPPTILQHQSGTEPSNGDYLYLLQAGNQVSQQHSPPYQPHGAGIGGIAGGRQDYHRQLASQYNLAMPGILPGGGENLMAAWDPAVAALGPSHSYNHSGVVARLVVDDERDFLSGSYPASPFQGRTMGSGWPTYNPTLPYPFPSPSLLPASCVSLSPPSDHRQFLGRTMISNPSGMPESLYGHVDMLQQRSVEGNSTNYQQPQLRVVQPETQSAPTLPLDARCRAGLTERSTHQQFFGNGAELMKLLQISTSKCSAEGPEPKALDKVTAGGGSGSSASGPKVSPAIAHGPIGPPKRSDGNARPTSADDLLGRFWPAPTAAVGNGSQQGHVHKPPAFGVVENSSNLTFKDQGKWGEQRSSGAEMWDRSVGGSESVSVSTFGSTDGGNLRFVPQSMWFPSAKPIGGAGLPDSLEFCNGRGLLGGWLGDLEGMGMTGGGGQQFRKGGVEARNKIAEQQSCSGLISLPDEQQQQRADGSMTKDMDEDYHPRDINGRIEAARVAAGGGTRRGPGIRGDCGSRRSGKSVVGHWVAVTDRQKDREVLEASIPSDGGTESCLEKSCTSAANSIKEESIALANEASGSQRGNREEQKRRKGQQQEWRMKIPSSQAQVLTQTQSSAPKVSGFPTDSESSDVGNGNLRASSIFKTRPLASQVDHPGLPSNLVQDAAATPGSAVEESKKTYDCRSSHHTNGGNDSRECAMEKEDDDDIPDTYDERDISLVDTPAQEESEFGERQEHTREFPRLAHRAPGVPSLKPEMRYRLDLEKFCSQLLDIYVSLIPTVEEIRTRRQFLSHLDHLVSREWPGAMLFLFGSCANAFGVRNSDIDVCLSISDEQLSKADLVLKMAAILRSDNMQNVVALTHARVPIVKFTDASTGISCDICVNNKLAVVNSKLLHDYSLIDERLRQLAFLVKHWAKRRQVNETYRGTLSSYAYVLMCIHFLQQRKPPILPCLQEMQPTYRVTVCDIDCSYYDRVETLQSFGISNKESLGELLTSFFEYWAFRHDYNKAVISVRTGGYLSKDEKEWTRRVGNERHLICIEDPLEVEHDLGRVVDRHSIRVLRDEFHRAAKVLRHDLNPCVALFEPYMRDKP